MHTFQPYPIDKMEFNPFTKIGKKWALVSAGDKTRCNTMTVSWGGVGVLWGKNVVFIFIRDSRYTKEFLDNGDLFSLSFLNEDYRDALNYCGSHSGRGEEDKFAAAGLTKAFRHDIPYPDEANLVLVQRSRYAYDVCRRDCRSNCPLILSVLSFKNAVRSGQRPPRAAFLSALCAD